MTQKLTRKQLLTKLEQACERVDEWDAASEPKINWRGATTKALSDQVLSAWDAVIELTYAEKIDQDARELVLEIDEMEDELLAWARAFESRPDSVSPAGTEALWQRWRCVRDRMKERKWPLPEPIADLTAQGVGDGQICRIYGWKNENGQPDFATLSKQREWERYQSDEKLREKWQGAKPQRQYDPSTWQHPSKARHDAEIQRRWNGRDKGQWEPLASEPPKAQPQEAPEPIEDLIAQGVPGAQVAKMKGVSVDYVYEIADQIDKGIDGRLPPSKRAEAVVQGNAPVNA